MIKRVDRYIGGAAVLGIVAVWLALTMLMLMFNMLDVLRDSTGRNVLIEVLWFVILTAPRAAYLVFPVSALLGALIGIGGLAATNELVAFRTAGVSRLRISGSAIGATLLVTIPVLIMGEWLVPAAELQARTVKQSHILNRELAATKKGLWVRDGGEFINIKQPVISAGRGDSSVDFFNVVIYSFGDDARLQGVTRARSATHDGEEWKLERVRQSTLGDNGIVREFLDSVPWSTKLKPDLLESAVSRPRYMSIQTLVSQLEYLGENGLDDQVYRSAFWAKIFYPFTAMALVLAGMPFVFGSARQHSIGVRIFIGMSLGGVFMIVSRAFQNMGDAYFLPSVVTTAGPSLLLMGVVILILRRSV